MGKKAPSGRVFLIRRESGRIVVGRIVNDDQHMRVQRRNPLDGSFVMIGYYEDLRQPNLWEDKVEEISSVFTDWARTAEAIPEPETIKANWTPGLRTPREYRKENSVNEGAVRVMHGSVEIARIYKYKDHTAVWVLSERAS